jgi:hypothetical protein
MSVVQEMAAIAKACVDKPNTLSVWVAELQRYVCVEDPKYKKKAARALSAGNASHPRINSTFKFSVLTSFGLGVFFVILCSTATIIAGGEPKGLVEYMVKGTFAIAQTSIGVALGLLGGPGLLREASRRK